MFRNVLCQIKAGEWADRDGLHLAHLMLETHMLSTFLFNEEWGFPEQHCFLSSPIWHYWGNRQTAPTFVSIWVFISLFFNFNIVPIRLQARKMIPLVILPILYLSHSFLSCGTTQLLPERFGRAAGAISNTHAKCSGVFIWWHALGSFIFGKPFCFYHWSSLWFSQDQPYWLNNPT